MRNYDELRTTTNRVLYNKLYRKHLDNKGKIWCSYCRPNHGCNKRKKITEYGGYDDELRLPNWKLVTKNKKQWMPKPLFFKYHELRYYQKKVYVEVTW
jgi:hypothetical protein